jgi:serine/threonine protein kinase/Tol biopolymer transport system component
MGSERWERVKILVDEALARVGTERERFLDETCAGDDALRADVESLLRYEQGGFLEPETLPDDDLLGQTLASYRIVGEMGRGGMGRVYRARDEKLGRSVAIKVLPERYAASPDRLKRFEREARLIAALNHPNVATIHGLEHVSGVHFLVLELVAGETLRERLQRGPLPQDEVLRLARQIAEALEAAHAEGIVHRDLKPSNVKITEDGTVKVLDFGLAKALRTVPTDESEEDETPPGDLVTQEGIVMGTPAYMSPEQVEGLPVDHRTDIWSFGVLLWELLTGERPFHGDSTQEVMAAVVRDEVPWERLSTDTPEALRALLHRCLTRDRRSRLQAIGEARILIERGLSGSSGSGTVHGFTVTRPEGGRPSAPEALGWRWPGAALLLVLCGLAVLAVFLQSRWSAPGSRPPLRKWSLVPPQELNLTTHNTDVKVSPNGRHITYRGDDSLWILDLEKESPRRIEHTAGAIDPFWSPDSAFIGYFNAGVMMKIPVQGGTPATICPIPTGESWGASWSPDGETIVISAGFPGRLYDVPARGGEAKLILDSTESASPEGPPLRSIYRPQFLPSEAGRRAIVFAFGFRTSPNLMVWDLETGQRKVLGAGALPSYSPSGHLVYQETGLVYRLWAVPFSLKTLDVTGRPFLIAGGGRDPAVSSDGTLVYVDSDLPPVQLTWFDRRGREVGKVGGPERCLGFPSLSPDGTRLAAAGGEDRNFRDAWVYDLGRGTRNRLTAAPENLLNVFAPVWSPRGDEVAFTVSNRDMVLRRADGSGAPRIVLSTAGFHQLTDWSMDGHLVYEIRRPQTGTDLAYLVRTGSETWEPHDFVATPFEEYAPKVSPDGRFVAYESNESGRLDVYVRPFPSGDRRWLVSNGGGRVPVWRRDGRELFYIDRQRRLVSVEVSTHPTFSPGAVTPLFDLPELRPDFLPFDVSADGSRFMLPAVVGEGSKPVIRVVQSWAAEFQSGR